MDSYFRKALDLTLVRFDAVYFCAIYETDYENFIFQVEVLEGLSLWYCLYHVADEKTFESNTSIHIFYILNYNSKDWGYYVFEQYVIWERLLLMLTPTYTRITLILAY